MGITKEELLARMDNGLGEMALGDIKGACRPGDATGGAKMAGFCWGSAFWMHARASTQGAPGR